MQTRADIRIGMLLRWYGDSDADDDPDDLGIVVKMPGENGWTGNYHIAWSITDIVSHHSPDMIEESLYQGQMEIV